MVATGWYTEVTIDPPEVVALRAMLIVAVLMPLLQLLDLSAQLEALRERFGRKTPK